MSNKNWWFTGKNNKNTLANNFLSDVQIAHFLQTSTAARNDFQAAFDLLNAKDQERIRCLVQTNVRATSPLLNDQSVADKEQKSWNTKGIHIPVKGRKF